MDKVYVKTYGCTMNFSDSEVMKGILAGSGYEIVGSVEEANVVVVNTCTVKDPAEKSFFRFVEDVRQINRNMPVVVAGCIAQATPELVKDYSLVGVDQVHMIAKAVDEALSGNIVKFISHENAQRLNLPKIRSNEVVEIIPINRGCLGNCSYCLTKLSRGNLQSFPAECILRQARQAIKQGVREIWLTSQDTGAYGKDIGTNIAELLKSVLSLEGSFMVRLGMINPEHVLENLDDLVSVFKSKKMFKFLHIPVQSGNNEILKKMRRLYSADDFAMIVKRFRNELPHITISTDVICGFPTETDEQFNDTIELIKAAKPDVLNISRYFRRPKTDAALMEQVSGSTIKQRSRKITEIFDYIAFEQNLKWKNWEGRIIVDEKGKNNTLIGRNYAYKQVIIDAKQGIKLGDVVSVKIIKTTKHDLRAEVIKA